VACIVASAVAARNCTHEHFVVRTHAHTSTHTRLLPFNYFVEGTWHKRVFYPKQLCRPDITGDALLGVEIECSKVPTTSTYTLFNSSQAKKCLSRKHVTVIGDSYARGIFVGIADAYTGDRSDRYIKNEWRHHILTREHDGFQLDFLPANSFYEHENSLIYDERERLMNSDFVVVSILVHDIKLARMSRPVYANWSIDDDWIPTYESHLRRLIDFKTRNNIKLVWVNGVSYDNAFVPDLYRKYQQNDRVLKFHLAAYKLMVAHNIPYIDQFTMTKSCSREDCLSDGSHRSRYVGRMLGNIILNYFCTEM